MDQLKFYIVKGPISRIAISRMECISAYMFKPTFDWGEDYVMDFDENWHEYPRWEGMCRLGYQELKQILPKQDIQHIWSEILKTYKSTEFMDFLGNSKDKELALKSFSSEYQGRELYENLKKKLLEQGEYFEHEGMRYYEWVYEFTYNITRVDNATP